MPRIIDTSMDIHRHSYWYNGLRLGPRSRPDTICLAILLIWAVLTCVAVRPEPEWIMRILISIFVELNITICVTVIIDIQIALICTLFALERAGRHNMTKLTKLTNVANMMCRVGSLVWHTTGNVNIEFDEYPHSDCLIWALRTTLILILPSDRISIHRCSSRWHSLWLGPNRNTTHLAKLPNLTNKGPGRFLDSSRKIYVCRWNRLLCTLILISMDTNEQINTNGEQIDQDGYYPIFLFLVFVLACGELQQIRNLDNLANLAKLIGRARFWVRAATDNISKMIRFGLGRTAINHKGGNVNNIWT